MYKMLSAKRRGFNAERTVGHILASTVPEMVNRLIPISILMALFLCSPFGL